MWLGVIGGFKPVFGFCFGVSLLLLYVLSSQRRVLWVTLVFRLRAVPPYDLCLAL